jgi:hypothetical protein
MQCNACMQRIYLHMYGIHSYVYTLYIHIYTHIYICIYIIYTYLSSTRVWSAFDSCSTQSQPVPWRKISKLCQPWNQSSCCTRHVNVRKKLLQSKQSRGNLRMNQTCITPEDIHIYQIYIYTFIYIEIYIYYTDTQDMKHIHILLWHVRWWNPHFGLIKSHPWVPRMT